MNQHTGFESVRQFYGVPARHGVRVTYRGYPAPAKGRLISCDGSHVWMRLDNGKRFGPLHPTSAMDYGDGRDYTAETNERINRFNRQREDVE